MEEADTMKIEKLTDDKLKITLSIDDLEERNINLHSFMYNSPESQDLFWELLQTAEKDYGFSIDDSFIYVEAATTGSGNFTLLVTKTNDKTPDVPKTPLKTKKITKESFKLKRKTPSVSTTDNFYVFQSFDDILAFCSICDTAILHENVLYQLNDCYYLKIDFIPYNMILDYASVLKSTPILEAKISEYGKVIIEHEALQTLAKHFNKKSKKKTS